MTVYEDAKAHNDSVDPNRYRQLRRDDLINRPPLDYLVRNVVPAKGLFAIYGKTQSAKSFLALDLACCLAGGITPWFGYKLKQANVSYVILEGKEATLNRISAWEDMYSRPMPTEITFVLDEFNLMDDMIPFSQSVINAHGKGSVVIVDTLSQATPGMDESSSKDMVLIVKQCQILQQLIDGLVIIIHHVGKKQEAGMRGSTVLISAVDGAIETKRSAVDRSWELAKSKDSACEQVHNFELKVIPVSAYDDGEIISSCAIDPIVLNKRIEKPSLTDNQQIAFRIILNALDVTELRRTFGSAINTRCVKYDHILSLITPKIPAEPKNQSTRAKESVSGLVKKGYLAVHGEFYWLK